MKIKDLPKSDRPREKLIAKGADNLKDSELLAILLRTGKAGKNVIEIASQILSKYSKKRLLQMTYDDLSKISGIDSAKATTLLAAFELSKRALEVNDTNLPVINNAKDAVAQLSDMRDLKKEHFMALYLNAKNQRYIEGIYTLRPFMIEFQNGAIIGWAIDYQYQNLEEDFYPLGIQIEVGEYHYLQYYASFLSDPSRRYAYTIAWRKGAFYDGLIDRYRFTLRYNIIPNISIAGDYFLTSFKNVGVNKIDLDVTLLSSELVLALNPKLQLTTRYQWNTANDMQNWNIRFSWEFRPLSYVYLIFNSNEWINSEATYANQNMIGKISYMMQF